VSLLLDALKRAEKEKQGRPEEPEARGPHLVGGKAALELQPIAAADAAASARGSPSQAAAQALAPPARKRRGALWIAGAAVVVLIALGAGYVWYSINELQPRPIARRAPLAPIAAPTQAPVAPPPQSSPTASTSATSATAPVPQAVAAPPVHEPPLRATQGRNEPPASAPAAALLQQNRGPVPRVLPEVRDGYEALRRGDLTSAKRSYGAAVANEPNNLDALLGLATVEARSGGRQAAVVHYRRALEVDPRNPSALAGLAALSDASQPEALEARLLREIAENPGSAALHYMLGNLYAVQGRWGQAQGAFYEAHRIEPEGADILHNLAVSLDQLGQGRMAAGFYRKALEASRGQPSAFDAAAVNRRLAELETAR
jgi:tetratricopeptide (TPR) repeat protein